MTDNLKLNVDAYLPLRDVVFHTLREAILKGELKPGERLMELQLASKLGVSRTPIREAIRMLEQEGLAVTIPRRGAEVARMTEKDMKDVLQIREVLDELAVRLACDNITKEEIKELEKQMLQFENSTKQGDIKKIAEADVAFHDTIYHAAGVRYGIKWLEYEDIKRDKCSLSLFCFIGNTVIGFGGITMNMDERNKKYRPDEEKHPVTGNLQKDSAVLFDLFEGCSDLKYNEIHLGTEHNISCIVAFIETTVENMLLDETVLGKMLTMLCTMKKEEVYTSLEQNSFGVSDMAYFETIEDAINGMLSGAALLLIDGFARAIKVSDKGYPGIGVSETDSEKVARGSNEGFANSIKTNTALIRKRIRSPQLKVKEKKAGVRSNTNISLLYMEGIAPDIVLAEIEKRLEGFEIDGVMDSGVIEQLSEERWLSPFPQFQTTLRPDRAAMCLLEGRVILLCDNSPVALILPTDYNSFIQTSDDYYNRFEIASLGRIIRYLASFFAMTLPGLYLAVTNFHTQILPTTLILSFAAARQGVPFPSVVEVILMELSFELLREAGIRLPGAMGNTIGIVGGLIIGQAAVEANIVSPVVVIVIAFTALCSFAIPNEEFAAAFRILKFFFIGMCAWLGFFGFLIALLAIFLHLASLKSFGIPYLMPFAGADLTNYQDERDSLLRVPLFYLKKRPIFASRRNKTRLRWKE